jgi:hypothetical protein
MVNFTALAQKYGRFRVVSGGRELLFVCPQCGREKLYISTSSGAGFCHRCHLTLRERGDVDIFSLPIRDTNQQIRQKRHDLGLPPEAIPLVSEGIEDASEFALQAEALEYLKQRGFTADDARSFDLHFCAKGVYAGRILFPVTYCGVVYSFIARDFLGRRGAPKVLMPDRSRYPEEAIARIGLDACINSGTSLVVLVEGPFDAMACGSPPAIALHGTSVSDVLFSFLIRRFRRFVLCLDPDAAGRKGADELESRLRRAGKDVVSVQGLEDDPGSYGSAIRGYIERFLGDIGWST